MSVSSEARPSRATSRPPMRPLKLTPALPFLLLGLGACSDKVQVGTMPGIDLLARAPDSLAYHPGEVSPTIVRDENGRVTQMSWGAYRGPGWRGYRPDLDWGAEGEHPFIESNQPESMLLLPAPAQEDRQLQVQVWLADASHASHATLDIKLNGRSLLKTALAVPAGPEVTSIEVPAALWREDNNRLEFSAQPHPDCESDWDTIRVGSVGYGEARSVQWDLKAASLSLAATTGVTYYIESQIASSLILKGSSEGEGALHISSGAVLPETGARSAPDASQTIRLDGPFETSYRVPLQTTGLAYVKLLWKPEQEAALNFNELFLWEEAAKPRPPIIFVSIDTLAARHMSVYGYGRETTPRLAEFAEQAVLFERCAANAPWTLPSYLSVMTGLYPEAHRTAVQSGKDVQLDNDDYWQVALNRWTLAESLRARGYQTAAAVDTQWLAPTWRIDQGFDLYDTSAFGPFDNPELGIKLILRNYETYLDEMRHPDAPCFTFIHALDAHGPYWPEAPYADVFKADLPERTTPTLAGCEPQSYGAIPTWMAQTITPLEQRASAGEWPIPRELPLERIIEMYDETILKVDDQLGKMFELLRERGLYDEAVIVISGDHGESFKHEFYSHGCMWEDIVHVPLLIKLPNAEFGGTRVSQSVQLVDLYPTLIELAGADPERKYLHGRSLLPLMRGEESEPRATFSEGGHITQFMLEYKGLKLIESFPGRNSADPALLTNPRIPSDWLEENFPSLVQAGMLTREVRQTLEQSEGFQAKVLDLKHNQIPGPYYELYDLLADPGELVDLHATRPEDVERLKRLMQIEKDKGVAARKTASADIRIPISAQDQADLTALGYAEETAEESAEED